MIARLDIVTRRRCELIDITNRVRAVLPRSQPSGVVIVYVPHTTAGVTINEHADPSVGRDILDQLTRLVPAAGSYEHAEGNADAHIKATLVGSSVTIPFEHGELLLGTWQGIFFCEFDGPRSRQVLVQIVTEQSSQEV